jgi:hypothetical protein
MHAVQSWPTRFRMPIVWLICLAPASYLILFYSFVLRAQLALGYWPQPYQPDPKDLDFGLHYAAVLLGRPLWMVSPAAVLLVVALQPRFGRRKLVLPALVFGLLYLAAWLVLRMDPGAFGHWFAD